MHETRTTAVSTEFLSWINEQLRNEIRRRKEEIERSRQTSTSTRTRNAFLTGLSGIAQAITVWLHSL